MKKIAFLFLVTISTVISAQSSAKAKLLLNEVSNKIKSYENIYLEFKYSLHNLEENIKQENRGNLTLKGEHYLLNYLGFTQMYNGKKLYTIIPENEEITIQNKSEDDENTINPSKMLTFYKEGYKYQWDILQNLKGRKIQYIKLIPINSNSEIKSILLGIDQRTKNIYNLIETGSDNTKTTITVNSFKTNQPLSKTLFTFDAKDNKYKDYLITTN